MDRIRAQAFEQIRRRLREPTGATEYDMQQFIDAALQGGGSATYDPPMVGTNDHPADPHFDTTKENGGRSSRGTPCSSISGRRRKCPAGSTTTSPGSGTSATTRRRNTSKIFNAVRRCARCGRRVRPGEVREGEALLRVAGRRCVPQRREEGGIREVLRPPDRPLDHRRDARQRRQHRQPGDEGRAPAYPRVLLLDRARHLS